MARMRLSGVSASKAAAAGVRCDRGSVTRSLCVLDEGNRRARIDAAKGTVVLLSLAARGRLALAASRYRGLANCFFNQLALRDRGFHNRAHVDLTSTLGLKLFPRSVCFPQCDGGQGDVGVSRLDERAPRAPYENPREIARIVLHQKLFLRPPDIGGQRRRPVPQIEQMDAVRS